MKLRFCGDCLFAVKFNNSPTILCKLKIKDIKIFSKKTKGCQQWTKRPIESKPGNKVIKRQEKGCKTCKYELLKEENNQRSRYCTLYGKNIFHPYLPCRDWILKEDILGRCISCKKIIFENTLPPNKIRDFYLTGRCYECQKD